MTPTEFGQKMHEGEFQSDRISFKKYLATALPSSAPEQIDLKPIIEKAIGQTLSVGYTDFDHHVAKNTCTINVERSQKQLLTFTYARVDGNTKQVLQSFKTTTPALLSPMLRPIQTDQNGVRQVSLAVKNLNVSFSVDDQNPIGLNSNKTQMLCLTVPVELPGNYSDWIEMRADDRTLFETKYFGAPIQVVVQHLQEQHPDWK